MIPICLGIRIVYRRMRRSNYFKCPSNGATKFVCITFLVLLTTVACAIHIIGIANSFYCLYWKTNVVFKNLCRLHRNGFAVGDLCPDLCDGHDTVAVLSCYTSNLNKEIVVTAKWRDRRVVIKSRHVNFEEFDSLPSIHGNSFDDAVAGLTSAVFELARLNYGGDAAGREFVADVVASSLRDNRSNITGRATAAAVDNAWTLFQQHEFLALKLFDHTNLFPKVVGTCGHLYAVEYVMPVSELLPHGWRTRINAAHAIVEILDELESRFQEPFRICDVKLEHFGVDDERRKAKILDADNVFAESAIKTIVNPFDDDDDDECNSDADCSLLDCEVSCDVQRRICTNPIRSNLQVVCERIFLPLTIWNSSPFRPHLLHTIPADIEPRIKSLIAKCTASGRRSSSSSSSFSYTPSAFANDIKMFL